MINYQIIRKQNMKRIVLRVKDGVVCVSAPPSVTKVDIDGFVKAKLEWIQKQLNRTSVIKPGLKHFDDDTCLKKFNAIAKNIYPLVAARVTPKPRLFVKDYRSRWGVCYPQRDYIILNKQLFDKPIAAIEQVILHEYVHFLVQNHGVKFHEIMKQLMPDYKERRKLLNR